MGNIVSRIWLVVSEWMGWQVPIVVGHGLSRCATNSDSEWKNMPETGCDNEAEESSEKGEDNSQTAEGSTLRHRVVGTPNKGERSTKVESPVKSSSADDAEHPKPALEVAPPNKKTKTDKIKLKQENIDDRHFESVPNMHFSDDQCPASLSPDSLALVENRMNGHFGSEIIPQANGFHDNAARTSSGCDLRLESSNNCDVIKADVAMDTQNGKIADDEREMMDSDVTNDSNLVVINSGAGDGLTLEAPAEHMTEQKFQSDDTPIDHGEEIPNGKEVHTMVSSGAGDGPSPSLETQGEHTIGQQLRADNTTMDHDDHIQNSKESLNTVLYGEGNGQDAEIVPSQERITGQQFTNNDMNIDQSGRKDVSAGEAISQQQNIEDSQATDMNRASQGHKRIDEPSFQMLNSGESTENGAQDDHHGQNVQNGAGNNLDVGENGTPSIVVSSASKGKLNSEAKMAENAGENGKQYGGESTEKASNVGLDDEIRSELGADAGAVKTVADKNTRRISVQWTGHANEVLITGTWLDWVEKIPLQNSDQNLWTADVEINNKLKEIELKFIVDGVWQISPDIPVVNDGKGNTNNIIRILH